MQYCDNTHDRREKRGASKSAPKAIEDTVTEER